MLWAYGVGTIITICILYQVYLSFILNDIYKQYGDLLGEVAKHVSAPNTQPWLEGLDKFWALSWKWLNIILIYALADAITDFIARHYAFAWRDAMTDDYTTRLKKATRMIEGESQRVQEDPGKFAEIMESLGMQAIKSFALAVVFLRILWDMSEGVESPITDFIIANLASVAAVEIIAAYYIIWHVAFLWITNAKMSYWFKKVLIGWCAVAAYLLLINYLPTLVWVSIISGFGGIATSWLVSIKLPGLEYNNQVVEAAYRKELVLGEEDRVNRAAPKTLRNLFVEIRYNYRRLFLHTAYFDLWRSWYGMIIAFLPSLLIAPNIFMGVATVGVLYAAENAFAKVYNGIAFIMYNWKDITKLRSIWKRLHEFEANLDKYQIVDNDEERKGNE